MSTQVSTGDKSIRSDATTYEALRQLAQAHGLSNTKLLAAMVQYFRVTKADPQQPTGPDLNQHLAQLSEKLDKLDKRTIGFIREQEKTYLKPILAEVQAHKVLSEPVASASAGLSSAQEDDLVRWFVRVLSRGMLPAQLTPEFLRQAPALGAGTGGEDPALKRIKNALVSVVQLAFRPELMVPELAPKPAPSTTPPPTQPA